LSGIPVRTSITTDIWYFVSYRCWKVFILGIMIWKCHFYIGTCVRKQTRFAKFDRWKRINWKTVSNKALVCKCHVILVLVYFVKHILIFFYTTILSFRNLSSVQDREICCYSISCKEKQNIGKYQCVLK
jgi:hypothetical protein